MAHAPVPPTFPVPTPMMTILQGMMADNFTTLSNSVFSTIYTLSSCSHCRYTVLLFFHILCRQLTAYRQPLDPDSLKTRGLIKSLHYQQYKVSWECYTYVVQLFIAICLILCTSVLIRCLSSSKCVHCHWLFREHHSNNMNSTKCHGKLPTTFSSWCPCTSMLLIGHTV